jgi:hypothetical protein
MSSSRSMLIAAAMGCLASAALADPPVDGTAIQIVIVTKGDMMSAITIAVGSGGVFETSGGALFSDDGYSAFSFVNSVENVAENPPPTCSIYEASLVPVPCDR